MRIACELSFKTEKATKQSQTNRPWPWWTLEFTLMRKTTNHLMRKIERTIKRRKKGDKKAAYFEQEAKYAATIKMEKTKSWKEYCNLTTEANTWNAGFRLAAGKKKNNSQLTTLR